MKIKTLAAAVGIALTTLGLTANAQKTYTHGTVTLSTQMRGQDVKIKHYFTADSSALAFSMGPASIKILADAKETFFAVLVDVPVAGIKKAGVSTPAEIEQTLSTMPSFTFAPTTETKQISGFNCKKVVATDSKTKKTYDIWITNDVSIPTSAVSKYYANIGGFPIQYTTFQQGQEAGVTVTSITDAPAPAGTFVIPSDFEKISMSDLQAMSGGGN